MHFVNRQPQVEILRDSKSSDLSPLITERKEEVYSHSSAKFRQKFFRENNMSKSNTLTAARLNFLYQSAKLISSPETNSIKVAHHYTQLMVNISQKAVQRLSKDLKRTICKRCKGLLKPGVTAKVGKEGKKIGSICQLCQAKKQFPIQCKGSKKKPKIF